MSSPPPHPTPDWQPTLRGNGLTLRPIRVQDADALYAAACDPLIWAQHSQRDRHERPVFEKYCAFLLSCGGGMVVVHEPGERIIGATAFYDWTPQDPSVVIGYSFLSRDHWGRGTNREMKRLMLEHAFQWVHTVWFHVSPDNARSQKALERIGAALHERRQVMVTGMPSERLIYRLRPGEFRSAPPLR
ncbi:MAG: GNAT family N-acetyltransferase [Planctomycetaceae bacterium]|jgi:RimJ/RimL family protein N-acetyltransferase|nr:GNAT family N-acetyltransferase [Planctomycetaceae bacterium]